MNTTHTNMTAAVNNKPDFWTAFSGIRGICAFVPIVTSLIWIIYTVLEAVGFAALDFTATYILFPIACIGWLAAVIACPMKILTMVFACIFKPFVAGFKVAFFPFSLILALILGGLGFVAAFAVLVYVPAAVTIPSFFGKE